MQSPDPVTDLLDRLHSTLKRLPAPQTDAAVAAVLPVLSDLVGQCERQLARQAAAEAGRDPIRLIHHFACSGGTVMSSCIAAMPNTILLNEIDPLSRLHLPWASKSFKPTDILTDMIASPRAVPQEATIAVFRAGLKAMRDQLATQGMALILRDHSHSHFCHDVTPAIERPLLRDLMPPDVAVRSVLTLRHPLDSFMSLETNKWLHFKPATLEEYSKRYLSFLHAYGDVARFKYEDFTRAPDAVLQKICAVLELPYSGEFNVTRSLFALSGDSGRSGGKIQPRPSRQVSQSLGEQAEKSPAFARLCKELDYDPAP
ncbi:sulfotransferase [Rhodobacteraceae bacterium LMO-12]|nr:sulfotransferase [Rhodobacteraceae bacterium LMO-JJ12]